MYHEDDGRDEELVRIPRQSVLRTATGRLQQQQNRWTGGPPTYPLAHEVAAHVEYDLVIADSDLPEDRLARGARRVHHILATPAGAARWRGRDKG